MPEGHTIHRLAKAHRALLGGAVVRASSPQGRFTDGAALIDGSTLTGTDAVGKHLFHHYADGPAGPKVLHVHLGLYGKFTSSTVPPPQPRGALRLRLITDDHWLDLRGPTACEVITTGERDAIVDRLGPDPLRRGADREKAAARIARSRAPIAGLLMDQKVLAGVGNVYRAEVLFRHQLDPYQAGRDLPESAWDAVWDDLCTLMRAGVRSGRIITTEREHRPARNYVYRRAGAPCLVCGTEIRVELLSGRTLFWCPSCQAP